MSAPSVFYDKNDYKLLDILEDLLNREVDHAQFKTILEPYLKPHGIKELAAAPGAAHCLCHHASPAIPEIRPGL